MSRNQQFNYFKCVVPVLQSLGWHGEKRRLYEAAPHLIKEIDIIAYRNLMSNLGYDSKHYSTSLKKSDFLSTPFLFVSNDESQAYVIKERTPQGYSVFNCVSGKEETLPNNTNIDGNAYSFTINPASAEQTTSKSWFRGVLERFRPHMRKIIAVTFFTSLFTLAIPIFIRSVYDFVIPTESATTLYYLILGMAMALVGYHFLHHIKARAMAYVGARINMFIGTEVMRQLLFMPTALVEGASVGSQVTRIKQFDAVRELFTGPLGQLFIEGPFIIMFILALAFLAGPIAIVPIILIFVFAIVAMIILPFIRKSTRKVSVAVQNKQTFLVETAANLMTIKHLGVEDTWKQRYFNLYKEIAEAQRYSEDVSSYASTISQTIMKFAGVASILWGAIRVMEGEMTVGSLLAVIILVWRALAPLQVAFMVMSRYDVILSSLDQINRLMQLPNEQRIHTSKAPQLKGLVRFENVSFRYPNDTKPAVHGVTLEAKPGDVLAIVGHNGSGKSSVIKLLLGFYQPQAGTISLDGIDIRQFDPIQLRQSVAYVPQHNHFFYGTIAQNLRLSNPVASDEELTESLDLAGLTEEIKRLQKGINTRIDDRSMKQFSSGFLQKLNLARAYCRGSQILILDEPGNTLDFDGDSILRNAVEKMRGKKTIIVVTHRPSMVDIADRVLSMRNGMMEVFGPKDKVVEVLQKAQSDKKRIAKGHQGG